MGKTYRTSPYANWRGAEHSAQKWMAQIGFSGTRVTPPGNDSGLDVVADRACAQVKNNSNPVGRPDLQRLAGAGLGYENLLFFSASGYTQGAKEFADTWRIALFILPPDGTVRAVNRAASSLIAKLEAESKALQAQGSMGCAILLFLCIPAILWVLINGIVATTMRQDWQEQFWPFLAVTGILAVMMFGLAKGGQGMLRRARRLRLEAARDEATGNHPSDID